MFHGQDPDGEGYSTRAHLAELIGMLGPPPQDLLKRGRRVNEFFDSEGELLLSINSLTRLTKVVAGAFMADVPVVETSLEESETRLEGDDKKAFLTFMRKMLQWRPEQRSTLQELFEDPWLSS